ncbi:MAG: hydrogen peroxide-inducible genes activator [Pseudomonadota bacterium]
MADLSLKQLRYFAALSRTLQYQRAARQLGISQPSLSLQIKALEEVLGGRLAERRKSGLILTPLGREVSVEVEKILRDVDALQRIAAPARDALSGTLRLGSSPTVGPYLLPRVLQRLHREFPDLKLLIRDGPPRELSEDLVAGRHDMILTQLPLPNDELRVQSLFREPLGMAVAREHPLASHREVRQADLAGESMLTLSPAYAMHRQVAALSEISGAILREDFEGTSLDALRQMVSLGMGVTLLPALYVQSEVDQADPDVVVVRMRPEQYRQVGLAWRNTSGYPPAFAKFAEILRSVVDHEFSAHVTLVR